MKMKTRIVLILLAVLLAGCAQPVYYPTPTPVETAPLTPLVIPFNPPTEAPTPEYPPALYLDPATASLEVGELLTVRVWGDSLERVSTLSLELVFDPQVVQIEDADPVAVGIQAEPGDLLQEVEENWAEEGRLLYRASRSPGEPATGSGVIFSFTIRGMAAGVAPLTLEQVAAQDASGAPVDVVALSDGLVTVGEAPPLGGIPIPATATAPERPGSPIFPSPERPGLPVPPSPEPSAPAPTAEPSSFPTGSGGIYYVVGPGENLFRIGLRFGTTAQAIAAANNIPDPRQVQAGTMLLIPVPAPGGGYGYCVRPGDTVYSIARRFGMSVEELTTLNNIGPDYTIHPDTILKVVPRR